MEPFPNALPMAVVVDCDYIKGQPLSYAGFVVISIDEDTEVARFYSGSPVEDFEDARFYSHSIATKIFTSANIDKFWLEAGFKGIIA